MALFAMLICPFFTLFDRKISGNFPHFGGGGGGLGGVEKIHTFYFFFIEGFPNKEAIESIKTQLESDQVGWLSHEMLPNGWKVRSKDRMQGEGQVYFQSPQIVMFKTNKAVLEFITSQRDMYSQENINKIKTFI